MKKRCPQCEELKESLEFVKNPARHDGLSSYCRKCKNAKALEIYYKTEEKKNCKTCKKEFTGYRNKIFCSPTCRAESRKIPDSIKLCEYCSKIFSCKNFKKEIQRFCSKKCTTTWLSVVYLPNRLTPEKRRILSERAKRTFLGKKLSLQERLIRRENNLGPRSHFWKGGITEENKRLRSSFKYSIWRTLVFQRDNFTCRWCEKKGGRLNADHIKPFAYFPELRFRVSNGRTLCEDCHKKTDTFAGRAKSFQDNTQLVKIVRLPKSRPQAETHLSLL